jgi:NADH dehydrogenase (ubiquinone) 1 alpha subcomplex subunit 9
VGDLGQVLFCPFELKDEDSIRRAVQHSTIVINLIGRGIETSNFSFEDVNIRGPAAIARICREMGVKRLVHMSSINARSNNFYFFGFTFSDLRIS